MSKVILGVLSTLFAFWILMLLGSCSENKVYIGSMQQTASGEYFCTFENKQVYREYLQGVKEIADDS